jgi:hypothetical protein
LRVMTDRINSEFWESGLGLGLRFLVSEDEENPLASAKLLNRPTELIEDDREKSQKALVFNDPVDCRVLSRLSQNCRTWQNIYPQTSMRFQKN